MSENMTGNDAKNTAAGDRKAEVEKKKRISEKERVEKRLAHLQAQIQAENAKLNAITRKERNGQLMAFGIFLETFLKGSSPDNWKEMIEAMRETVEGRNLERCLNGIRRLLGEIKASPKRLAEFEPLLAMPAPDKKSAENDSSAVDNATQPED